MNTIANQFTEAFSKYVKECGFNLYAVTAITDKGETSSHSFQPCNPCQNSYSVSKFFTLTAIGLLWDEGLIDPSEKLTDIFGTLCPENMDDEWKNKTVEMAILHLCGLPAGYLNINKQHTFEFGNDYLSYVLSTPPKTPCEYTYTDAEFYLLSRAVSIRARRPMIAYLWEKLLYPLGFAEAGWSTCPMNYEMGATGLFIRNEDMAKLGALYLNNGIYHGQRILSEAWVQTVITKHYLPEYTPYGYGHPGMKGQMLAVFPKIGLTVAWQGYHDGANKIKSWVEDYFNNHLK